jgi:hypothetical protein
MTLTKLKKPVETQAYAFLPKNLCTGESYRSNEDILLYKNVADAINVDHIPEDTTLAIVTLLENDNPVSSSFSESPFRVITAFRLISYVSFDYLHETNMLFDILDAGPNAIKNLMALYATEIEEFTTINGSNTAFIMTEQDLHGEYQCSREVKAYDSTKAFFRALPKTKPEHCYIYTVSVNSIKEIEDPVEKIKAKLWGYQITTRFTIRDGLWSIFDRYEMNCDVVPVWFQLMAVQYKDGAYAENFIDDVFPEEVRIKAFELFEVDEDIESSGYNLDTVYKALADDNPKIRTAILRNESLKDLRWRYRNVLEIASHDEDATVKAFAVEELSKL